MRTNVHESHLIPIDFNKVLEMPESHSWCKSNTGHESSISLEKFVVPVIDMYDPNAMHLMKKACEEVGMFQIINHGIDTKVFEELEDQTRELFSLPFDQKLQAVRKADDFSGYGRIPISPFFERLMWQEGFTIRGSPLGIAHLLWPHDSATNTTFCNVITKSQEALHGLSQRIFSMILMSLGLTYDDLKWPSSETDSISNLPLQLNSYPICPDPSKAIGMAPHTDSSLITLLHQINTSGLQVFHEKAGWVTVELINGALVVNLGDLFHILSNGILKSALHQVVVNPGQERFSAAFFYGPTNDVDVSPAMKLVGEGRLPLYRSVTWKEYIKLKYSHDFAKALELVRLAPEAEI